MVNGCSKRGYYDVSIKETDEYGNMGSRCSNHFDDTCTVNGCSESGCSLIQGTDLLGPPGPRCTKHKESPKEGRDSKEDDLSWPRRRCCILCDMMCCVDGCSSIGVSVAHKKDIHGACGPRCDKHPFVKTQKEDRSTKRSKSMKEEDRSEKTRRRCCILCDTLCGITGCSSIGVSVVKGRGIRGKPGPRCALHSIKQTSSDDEKKKQKMTVTTSLLLK